MNTMSSDTAKINGQQTLRQKWQLMFLKWPTLLAKWWIRAADKMDKAADKMKKELINERKCRQNVERFH